MIYINKISTLIFLIVILTALTGCSSKKTNWKNSTVLEIEFQNNKFIEEKKFKKFDNKLKEILAKNNLYTDFIYHDYDNPLHIIINLTENHKNIDTLTEKLKEEMGDITLSVWTKSSLDINFSYEEGDFLYFDVVPEENQKKTQSMPIKEIEEVFSKRLEEEGIKKFIIYNFRRDNFFVVLPKHDEMDRIINILEQRGLVEFKEQSPKDPNIWETVLIGEKIKYAEASNIGAAVAFELKPDAIEEFADITERNIQKTIGIYLDGKEVSAPVIQSAISDGHGQIIIESGDNPEEKAQFIAKFLRSGPLPISIKFKGKAVIYKKRPVNILNLTIMFLVFPLCIIIFALLEYLIKGRKTSNTNN